MSQPIEASAAEDIRGKPAAAGWKFVEDAPTPDLPQPRHPAAAQRGMVLILLGGGLFWGAVAAAIWFASR